MTKALRWPIQKIFPVIAGLFLLFPSLQAQNIPIGHWRHHLPNHEIIALTETSDQIVASTRYGLVIFNKADNSLEKINKVHGLADFGISALAHSPELDLVLIGYQNGNIDIIRNKTSFINVPDIKNSGILGSRSINSIKVMGQKAYLSCGFGIVELDLLSFLILDTYFIGPQGSQVEVYDLAATGSHFYAATNAGLLKAPLHGVNLADYRNWQREQVNDHQESDIQRFNYLAVINNKVFANLNQGDSDTLYFFDGQWQVFDPQGNGYFEKKRNVINSRDHLIISNPLHVDIFDQELNHIDRIDTYYDGVVRVNDALFDSNQQLWMGDIYFGLTNRTSPTSFSRIVLPGPASANSFGLASAGGRTWVAPGAITVSGHNSWIIDGVFMFGEGRWNTFNRFRFPIMENVADIITLAIPPGNPSRIFAASWSEGILEFSPEGPVALFNDQNSTLRRRFNVEDQIRVSGMAFDRRGNLWVANSQVELPLHVMKENGEWISFPNAGIINPNQLLGELIIDRLDQKWVVLPLNNGIFLFKENSLDNPNDFEARRLTTQENNGGLPSNNVFSLAVDHDGYVWVGTDEGVAVFYTPQRAFSGEPFNAQQIIVEQDGFAAILLGTETINTIAVDGSNKKWFGTARSGAYLLASDGRETIFHFTTENSPLPSNNILDISIDEQSGEVFFATEAGLASFRGLATQATATHSDVYAFPNPVRPHHEGYIAINGLVRNAWVKITDISGNLVYETIAEGGQAVWNGRDLSGRRPSTGVYLVFSTNDDGTETMVTKIMFIN